jgi:hypothetical protein
MDYENNGRHLSALRKEDCRRLAHFTGYDQNLGGAGPISIPTSVNSVARYWIGAV